jgi:hypothetical protein
MLDVVSPFILWPIGIALGGLLFFEIEKRSWRVIQWPAVSRLDQRRSDLSCRPQTLHPAKRQRPGQTDLRKVNEYLLGTRASGRSRGAMSTRLDTRPE